MSQETKTPHFEELKERIEKLEDENTALTITIDDCQDLAADKDETIEKLRGIISKTIEDLKNIDVLHGIIYQLKHVEN